MDCVSNAKTAFIAYSKNPNFKGLYMKQSTDFYKAAAKRASTFLLKHRNLKMKQSQALELVAAIFNQPNWQTLNAIGQNEIHPDLLLDNNDITSISLESSQKDDKCLLPFDRPASPWKENTTIFINPEGELVPYQPISTSETVDPLELLQARLQMEIQNNPRYQQLHIEHEKIRNSPEMVRLKEKTKDLVEQLNQQASEMVKSKKIKKDEI